MAFAKRSPWRKLLIIPAMVRRQSCVTCEYSASDSLLAHPTLIGDQSRDRIRRFPQYSRPIFPRKVVQQSTSLIFIELQTSCL